MEILVEIWTKILALFEAVMQMDATTEILPMIVMWGIGGFLIYLAIAKDMEPTLLLPMGFGTILVNIPSSGALRRKRLQPTVSIVRRGRM